MALIRQNDDWKDDQRSEIEGTVFQPSDDRESVIVATLTPGAYTALMTNKLGAPGIGIVELYDGSLSADSELANKHSRHRADRKQCHDCRVHSRQLS